MLTRDQIKEIESSETLDALRLVANLFPEGVVFSSSLGQEDQVLTDIIFKSNIPVKIFTIDTGRLYAETFDLLDRTIARYKHNIEVFFPEASDVEMFVNSKGVNSFYESVDNRKECCHIRKVKPLNRALKGAQVWMTGLRAGQSENRHQMPMMEWIDDKQIYKFNPLINWSYAEMILYISKNNVPYNHLHDKGFVSIGCAPCTRAIEAGEEARTGRWWWETSQKECGLHQHVTKATK